MGTLLILIGPASEKKKGGLKEGLLETLLPLLDAMTGSPGSCCGASMELFPATWWQNQATPPFVFASTA